MSDIQQTMEALRALREEVKSITPHQDVIERCQKFLDAQEDLNQKLVREKKQLENEVKEIKDYVAGLEANLKRTNITSDEKEKFSEELKAFEAYSRKSFNFLKESEYKYLRTDSDTEGGYLLPEPIENQIIKKITEISNLRAVAKIRTMSTKTLSIPSRTDIVSVGMVGEGDSDIISNSLYGKERLTARKGEVTTQVSVEELDDSSYDLINLMSNDVGEAFAKLEGAQFVNGTGAGNNCEGFMTNTNIPFIVSGSASGFAISTTSNPLIAITGKIKRGYNPVYALNRTTLSTIMQIADTTNRPIWQAGNISAGIPNQLNGFEYIVLPDMPDIAPNAFPIIFGDFSAGYTIGDRKGLTMLRDDVSQKRNGKVEFTWYKRFAGLVQLPEAFCKIKIST